ncbi:hypothetical protein JYU34_013632 [Plutella xylostella]|uniref:Uncharacterized protein n=1 Tax=Plutella xylostella TaxID=51655 RepID=A0ABQ7QAF5_PLUXY|nr:hypothetical protein JYU34_013632 [Plutella xylostella]
MKMGSSMYVAFLAVAFAALFGNTHAISDENREKLKKEMAPIFMECAKEGSLNLDDLKQYKGVKELPADEGVTCFFACAFKKIGMIDDKGMFAVEESVERGKKYMDSEEKQKHLEEAANTCAAVNDESVSDGDKGCERAKHLYECLIKQAEKFGLELPTSAV